MEVKSPFDWTLFTIQQPQPMNGPKTEWPFVKFSLEALSCLAVLAYFFRHPQLFIVLLSMAAARDLAVQKRRLHWG